MELEFTAEQDDLRDAIRAVLVKESPVGLARAVVEGRDDGAALWRTQAELGWPGLTIDAAYGGIGLGAVEAAILAEELGRAVAPGPLLPTVTQYVPVVRAFADDTRAAAMLGAVARGTTSGTLAITEESGSYDLAHVTAAATPRKGGGVVLHGSKRYVVAGGSADEIAVVVRREGTSGNDGLGAVVLRHDDLAARAAFTPVHGLDASRPVAHVDLDGVEVPAERVLGDFDAGDALRRAVEEATVGIALEMVGTAQTIFDVTLDYVKHREQFGRPVGSFQAVKHKLADVMVALERARATGYFAALTVAEDDPRRATAVSVAKSAAGDCQRLVAKEGIQLHGGIGYTWEHDMHIYVKRIKADEVLFGSSASHRARIADLLGV